MTILDNHKPSLESGTYKFKISQVLNVSNNIADVSSSDIDFIVQGEEYSIDQLQIDSVFPPAASIGDFSLMFPLIVLNRSTLPWERHAQAKAENVPWLALILISEDEITGNNKEQKQVVFHIKKTDWESDTTKIKFEDAKSTPTQKDELISVIAAPPEFFKDRIANLTELTYLSHVRSKENDPDKAVVICNKLPKKDKKNILHLVSLENSFVNGKFIGKKDSTGNIGIVTLKSWEFFCNDHFIITKEVIDHNTFSTDLNKILNAMTDSEYFSDNDLFKAIDKTSECLHVTLTIDQVLKEKILTAFRVGHLPDILKHLNRTPCFLQLNKEDEHSKQGFIPIKYTFKTGIQVDALYRGPLTPVIAPADNEIIIHSDEALRYFSDAQKLDISYAAAWELGKLLALQNKNFSTALYQWKRACYQALKTDLNNFTAITCPVPPTVKAWFKDPSTGIINDPKIIPFNYLVPDPSIIPFESIRFFKIDNNWLKYFVDGAFSIARISKAELELDKKLYSIFEFLQVPAITRTGFVLHSLAVGGWPDMVIYSGTKDNVPYRKDRLSKNLLFCFFNSEISAVTIYQKQQSVHFGVKSERPFTSIFDLIKTDYKLPETPVDGSVSKFTSEMLQGTTIVTLNIK